jgi:hypothetical protein
MILIQFPPHNSIHIPHMMECMILSNISLPLIISPTKLNRVDRYRCPSHITTAIRDCHNVETGSGTTTEKAAA